MIEKEGPENLPSIDSLRSQTVNARVNGNAHRPKNALRFEFYKHLIR